MSAHSPCPWITRPWSCHAPTTVICDGAGEQNYPFIIAECSGNGGPETAEVEAANARLIAAAPDLLAIVRKYASECANCNGAGLVKAVLP